MELLYVLNFLFCLMHVNFLTKGGMSQGLTAINWFALGLNSLPVITQLLI